MRFYRLFLWILVIGVLCFTPGNEVRELKFNIPHFDKLIHFIIFFGLGLFIKGIQNIQKRALTILIVFSIVYAFLIELIQHYFIFRRSGDLYDFIFDLFGLFIGLLIFKYLPVFVKRFFI